MTGLPLARCLTQPNHVLQGTDSSQIRQSSPTTEKSASIHIEEESCTDEEMNHVTEVVGWLALESGSDVIHAQSDIDLGCVGVQEATQAVLDGPNFFDPTNAANYGSCYQGDAECPDWATCGSDREFESARQQECAGHFGTSMIDFINPYDDSATCECRRPQASCCCVLLTMTVCRDIHELRGRPLQHHNWM